MHTFVLCFILLCYHYQLWVPVGFMWSTWPYALHGWSLKRKCFHFDEILTTGRTGSCQNENFQCSQWWKFRQNDDIFVSVVASLAVVGTQKALSPWEHEPANDKDIVGLPTTIPPSNIVSNGIVTAYMTPGQQLKRLGGCRYPGVYLAPEHHHPSPYEADQSTYIRGF